MTKTSIPFAANLSRRTLIKAGAASTALIAAPALIRSARAEENVLYVNTWGGTWTAAQKTTMFDPFTKETGIEIRPVTPVSFAKLKAQVQNKTYEFDVTSMNSIDYWQAEAEGLVEPLDYKLFDKSKVNPHCLVGQGVTSVVLGTPLIYNKKKYPNGGPKNWADFWDVKKFPGQRALYSGSPPTVLCFALLADGVPKDKLFPLDIDRAFRKLNAIKPHIKVWWTQAAQSEQLMRDGEVDMMSIWSSHAQTLIDEGIPIQVVWNQSQNDTGVWFMAKGAPRKKAAMKWLEFLDGAKVHADFCEKMAYGPSNPDSFKYMSKKAVAESPTNPAHEKLSFHPDSKWLQPRMGMIRERWSQWISS